MSTLSFPELFEIEIEGWMRGIEANQKNITPHDLHNVIKEMACVFEIAIQQNYLFDLIDISNCYSKASKGKVNAKEVAFYILSTIPHPNQFNEESQKTLAEIINQVEQEFGGAKERLQKRWSQKVA